MIHSKSTGVIEGFLDKCNYNSSVRSYASFNHSAVKGRTVTSLGHSRLIGKFHHLISILLNQIAFPNKSISSHLFKLGDFFCGGWG